MEIRVLRYFLMIARELNITRAAERLHISQPALSRQLKELEEEIGMKLLNRSSHKITLTSQGMILKKRAEEILSMVDRTLEEVRMEENEISGELWIGAAECQGFRFFSKELAAFMEQYPSVEIHLFTGNTEAVCEKLDQGLFDFAIIVQDPDLQKYNALCLPGKDRWGLIMPEHCKLAEKDTIVLEDLLEVPLIVSRQGMKMDYPVWFFDHLDKLNIRADFDLIHNAAILVENQVGYALSLDGLVDTGKESSLTFRPLAPGLLASSWLIWKKHPTFSPAANRLLETIKEKVQETGQEK